MDSKDFVELFVKDCDYYDKDNIELNTVLSLIDFKPDETLIDIGAGIGRLAIPLSKHLKVTAIDTNKALINQITKPDIRVIHGKIEEFNPKEKYDYGLIVWPGFHNYREILNHIQEKVLKKNGKLIIIKSKEHDLKRITKKLYPDIFGQRKRIFEVLRDFFEIEKKKIIKTRWIYPNFEEALKLIIFELEAFYEKNINDEQKKVVEHFIREHEKEGKIYMGAILTVLVCNPKE